VSPVESDAQSSNKRPPLFDEGMGIGLHLNVERLLSMGPGRTYYLANNKKPRWYTHICWNCGNKHNPAGSPVCEYCQTPIKKRRFLLSCRWHEEGAEHFHRFAAERIDHLALNTPIVLYRYREQLLAFHEIEEEALLVDEPAPLRPRTLLTAAWTLSAGIIELLERGFVLDRLGPEHVLVGRNGSRLWDLDFREVRPRRVHPRDPVCHDAGRLIGRLLLPYVGVDQSETIAFFQEAAIGGVADIATFQRELRRFARGLEVRPSPRPAAALSSVGRKRAGNEDSWGWARVHPADADGVDVFVVADGMGGYVDGDRASRTAVSSALRSAGVHLPKSPTKAAAVEKALEEIVATVALGVRELAKDREQPVGTTIVVLVRWPDGTSWLAHVGDSRAYRIRGKTLTPLTEDHSMVAAMVATGKISREEARTHKRANVLLQFLGGSDEVEPDVEKADVKSGDRVLICSDGLWGEMPEEVLAALLDDELEPRRQVRVLVNAANDAGGSDNVTALLVTL
jgi:protein phosphatase